MNWEKKEINGNLSIGSLDIVILKDILCSDSLQILNDLGLLQLIYDLGSLSSELIGSVRFEYLSPSSIDLFFEQITVERLTEVMWHQLQIRSRHRIVYGMKMFPLIRFKSCLVPSPESPWSGLICHLCEMCDGNVHEKGMIEITCSSTGDR
jgi:hypothetical protein